jgi:uncharacterized protein (UPF0210 family)
MDKSELMTVDVCELCEDATHNLSCVRLADFRSAFLCKPCLFAVWEAAEAVINAGFGTPGVSDAQMNTDVGENPL